MTGKMWEVSRVQIEKEEKKNYKQIHVSFLIKRDMISIFFLDNSAIRKSLKQQKSFILICLIRKNTKLKKNAMIF